MYYIVIALVFIIKFCCSDKRTVPPGVVVNISKRRPKDVHVLRQTIYCIDSLVFTGANTYINEVVDNNGNIWKNDKGGLVFSKVSIFRVESRLLHIYLKFENGTYSSRYYYRNGRVWNEVNADRFYTEFDIIRSRNFAIGDYTLYLNGKNKPNKSRINIPENPEYAAYSPSFGFKLTKICDFNLGLLCFKSVWTPKDDEHCLFISVHNKVKPTLAYLIIYEKGESIEKYFYKPKGFNKRWLEIDKSDYLEKVKSSGFDPVKFDNSVELDLDNIDEKKFYSSHFGFKRSTRVAYPRPGLRMTKVRFRNSIMWEKGTSDSYCHYVNLFSQKEVPYLCYFLLSEGDKRRIEYYINNDGQWEQIEKKRFYHLLAKKDDSRYTHKDVGLDDLGNRKVEMSYFQNKQGLIIRSYRSLVENHKGVIYLTHGLRSHFLGTFLKPNLDWNYANFGFSTHPYLVCPNLNLFNNFKSLFTQRYSHIYEFNFFDNHYHLDKFPMHEYSGSMLEALNNLGYSVYGIDLQSHGYSESFDSIQCHVKEYINYIDDVTQFMFIIRNNKFLDTEQKWTKSLLTTKTDFKDRFILLGFSLGSNLFMRSFQEYKRKYKTAELSADGLMSLSGMYDIKNDLRNWFQRMFAKFMGFLALVVPRKLNPYQHFLDYGQTYDFTIFLNDDRYCPYRFTWKTLRTLFVACDNVFKYKKYYPKTLPTYLVHSTNDPGCSIRGVRECMKQFKGYNIESHEITGNYHHIYKTESLHFISELFTEWMEKITKKSQIIVG